jgi:hypothetical protein
MFDWGKVCWLQVESGMVTVIVFTGILVDVEGAVVGEEEGLWCSLATFLGCWKRARVHGVPRREVKNVDMTGEVYVSNGRRGRSEVEVGKDWVFVPASRLYPAIRSTGLIFQLIVPACLLYRSLSLAISYLPVYCIDPFLCGRFVPACLLY